MPFGNLRKLIHLRGGSPGPLPGDDAADFFAAWLAAEQAMGRLVPAARREALERYRSAGLP